MLRIVCLLISIYSHSTTLIGWHTANTAKNSVRRIVTGGVPFDFTYSRPATLVGWHTAMTRGIGQSTCGESGGHKDRSKCGNKSERGNRTCKKDMPLKIREEAAGNIRTDVRRVTAWQEGISYKAISYFANFLHPEMLGFRIFFCGGLPQLFAPDRHY